MLNSVQAGAGLRYAQAEKRKVQSLSKAHLGKLLLCCRAQLLVDQHAVRLLPGGGQRAQRTQQKHGEGERTKMNQLKMAHTT